MPTPKRSVDDRFRELMRVVEESPDLVDGAVVVLKSLLDGLLLAAAEQRELKGKGLVSSEKPKCRRGKNRQGAVEGRHGDSEDSM